MVKRKAEISLDEWLVQSARLGSPPTKETTEAPTAQSHAQCPTPEKAPSDFETHQPIAAEPRVIPTTEGDEKAQVTRAEGEAHEWFWKLLEQAGFERW